MDDFTVDVLNTVDRDTLPDQRDREDARSEPIVQAAAAVAGEQPSPRRWKGLAALRDRANVQDKLLEKLLQQVIPPDDGHVQDTDTPDDSMPAYSERPGFNITTMSNNFRRFNARIGVMFKFQVRVTRLLSWRRTSHTLSFLAVYTLVCLDPYLLPILPLAILIFGVLIPAFMSRHPSEASELNYSPRGPPIAPARTVKPVKELSRDFFRNMRDLQNSMEDFSVAHDAVTTRLVPRANFSDEAESSALFVALAAAAVLMSIASHLLPWRLIFLSAGWAAIVTGHPAVARALQRTQGAYAGPASDAEARARSLVGRWVAADIILDSAPETREVEIFELQRLSAGGSGEWEAWLFSPSPFDPLSQPRIAGERPAGTRFFEDVLAPPGWEWSEKKWALDLWSREWVEERIITGVEVETEGERWVYDIYNEQEAAVGLAESPPKTRVAGAQRLPNVSWEEGEEGEGRRGEWRRRRWVRLVKRKVRAPTA